MSIKIEATLSGVESSPIYRQRDAYSVSDLRDEIEGYEWYADFRPATDDKGYAGYLRIRLPSKDDAQAMTVGTKYTITLTEMREQA